MKILTEQFLNQYKDKQPNWGYNGLGYLIYKRTYSRTKEDSTNEEWWETISRCIEGAQEIGADYTQEEAEKLFDLIFNLKCNFAGRMLWQLGTSNVHRFGMNSLINCFSYETEIITKEGIKKIGDLEGKVVEVMTEYGKYVFAPIKSFGIQELVKLKLCRKGTYRTIYTTKNHRWFRYPERHGIERNLSNKIECTTSDLKEGHKLISTYGQGVKNIKYISPFGIAHGIVFGDGSISNNIASIRLCGEKNKLLLKYFNSSPTYNCEDDIIVTQLPKYFKEKPSLSMDKSYLYGWLAGYFAADGNVSENGQIKLNSANIENLYFVRDICTKLGIQYSDIHVQSRIGIGQVEPSEIYNISFNANDMKEDFFLIDSHKKNFKNNIYDKKTEWRVVSVENTDRKEKVFCAEVPDTHSFVLEGNILTGNCFFTKINTAEDFCFLFENLMLGGGVGFSVKREDIHELPKVKKDVKITNINKNDADFIVPDSREGWVNLLRKVLRSYFVNGKSFTYSTQLVRGYGEPIKTLGGTASGPKILVDGIENICKIFKNREGKKLRSLDVLDICNNISAIVVSGNLRRSACISLGDADDYLFVRAKRWDLGNIPNWRAMSNNTIYADDFNYISNDIWEGFKGNGEPYGLFNVALSQKFGRLNEKIKDNCEGVNPCGELPLENKEVCCLSEIYLNNITSKEELITCALLLYKTQKAITRNKFINTETEKVVNKNSRIGIGITGVCQSMDKISWLDDCYKFIREFDKKWSKIKGYPESIKITTIKPSGTLSLLAGATPGIHPAFATYYIRRVRMSSDDKLIPICKELGYKIEYEKNFDGSINHGTSIVEFPCYSGEAIIAKEMTAVKQLELVKMLQTLWADNSISVTVYYKKEELEDIKKWLKVNYKDSIKSVSFLLHNDHGFKQAPYEEISKEQYNELMKTIKPISTTNIISNEVIDVEECAGGSCPIK